MNSYQSLRKPNTGSAVAAILLAVCVLISASLLFSRLMGFAPADTRHYIPLTKSGGITTVREGQRQSDGSITFRHAGYHPDHHRLLTANPGFRVIDRNTVWTGNTDIEVFRVVYERDDRTGTYQSRFSVVGADHEKVIAPGTDNIYRFALDNTGNVALDYKVTFDAVCEIIDKNLPSGRGTAYEVPVNASVSYTKNNTESYLFGTATTNTPIVRLDNVKHSGTIGAGRYIPYTLYWEWPFESGNDTLDTFLGNEAARLDPEGQEIRLTVTIRTVAEYSPNTNADDGIPKTGDDGIRLAVVFLAASAAGLLFLLILPRRKRREVHG